MEPPMHNIPLVKRSYLKNTLKDQSKNLPGIQVTSVPYNIPYQPSKPNITQMTRPIDGAKKKQLLEQNKYSRPQFSTPSKLGIQPSYDNYNKSQFVITGNYTPQKQVFRTPQTLFDSTRRTVITQVIDNSRINKLSQIHLQALSHETVEPMFRYCFSCEELILQYNMDNHQKKCENLQQLYNKNVEDLLKITCEKIAKIKRQMVEILKNKVQNPFDNLNENIEDLLQSSKKKQEGDLLDKEFDNAYQKIQKCYQSKELKLLQYSYKLRWFLKIREQIKKKFTI